jgi:hypothetical protein
VVSKVTGAKFVEHANHVLNVLGSHDAWGKSQRELGHAAGVRPSLLSEVVAVLEETGRVRRGEPLPGPGRQRAIIVLNTSPLRPSDVDPACGTGTSLVESAEMGTVRPMERSHELGASVFNLLREMVDRLEELTLERKVYGQRLQELREGREEERARATEVVHLKHRIVELEGQLCELRRQNNLLMKQGKAPGRQRSVAALDADARRLLERLQGA